MAKAPKKAGAIALRDMTAEEYARLRGKLGLSNYAIGPALGFSRTVNAARRQARRYEAGDPIPPAVAALLRIMVKRGIKPEELD